MNHRAIIRKVHFYVSLLTAGMLAFYALTGFLANHPNFYGENVDRQELILPKGVGVDQGSLHDYFLRYYDASEIVILEVNDLEYIAKCLTDNGYILVTVDIDNRIIEEEIWKTLPLTVKKSEDVLPWLENKFSGHWKQAKDAVLLEMESESVWKKRRIKISLLDKVWLLKDQPAPFIKSLVDLHRGKGANGAQGFLVDITALSILISAITGIYLGLETGKSKRRQQAAIIIFGSLFLTMLYILGR